MATVKDMALTRTHKPQFLTGILSSYEMPKTDLNKVGRYQVKMKNREDYKNYFDKKIFEAKKPKQLVPSPCDY